MKTKVIDTIRMIILGVILAAIMLLGSIETIRAAIYMLMIVLGGFAALALVSWYDDYFVEDGE